MPHENTPRKSESGKEEITGLISRYVRSIVEADTNLAAQVWADSPEVSLIHPGGHERGWEAIKRNFYESTMRDSLSSRKLTIRDVAVHVSGDSAWVEFYWVFDATLRRDNSAFQTKGRETQVYRKNSHGRWELVHVHYSGLPKAPG